MKTVKRKAYTNAIMARRVTEKAMAVMEPGTKMTVKINPKGLLILNTNSPAALEVFQSEIFNFDNED